MPKRKKSNLSQRSAKARAMSSLRGGRDTNISQPRTKDGYSAKLVHKCPLSGKGFVKHDLNKHLKTHHQSKTNIVEDKQNFLEEGTNSTSFRMNKSRLKNMLKIFSCEECGNSYTRNQTLQNHLLNKHPTKHTQKTFQFKCDMCNYQFNYKRNLDYHQRKVHNINKSQIKLQCPLCEHTATTNYKLIDHFKSQHELEIQIQNKTFLSLSEFLTWKKEIEGATKSSFIKKRFIKIGELKNHYFDCSRSGHYVPSGEGKRNLKAIGSKKINGVCPAHMIVRESNDGKCTVTFTETHVGHNADLGHLYLTKSERKNLALKIHEKVPFDTILDEARVSVYESNLQRIHLLTKKDLHNIRKSCNLSSSTIRQRNCENLTDSSASYNNLVLDNHSGSDILESLL